MSKGFGVQIILTNQNIWTIWNNLPGKCYIILLRHHLWCTNNFNKSEYFDNFEQFTREVLCHTPSSPSLPDHALHVLNHDRTNHIIKPMDLWGIAAVA